MFYQYLLFHSSELFEDLQCLVQNTGTTILLGGHQPHLIEFDLMSAKEIRKVKTKIFNFFLIFFF